jgi:hypothetical protein
MELYLHLFSVSALKEDEWSGLHPTALTARKAPRCLSKECGSKLVWAGRRGEESINYARNRTTFRRLSSPYSHLYIDIAVKILHIFCVVEIVLRSNDRKICDSSLHSIRNKLLVYNSLVTQGLRSLPLYPSCTELPESHNTTEYLISF